MNRHAGYVITTIGLLSALIAIYVFISGNQSFKVAWESLFPSKTFSQKGESVNDIHISKVAKTTELAIESDLLGTTQDVYLISDTYKTHVMSVPGNVQSAVLSPDRQKVIISATDRLILLDADGTAQHVYRFSSEERDIYVDRSSVTSPVFTDNRHFRVQISLDSKHTNNKLNEFRLSGTGDYEVAFDDFNSIKTISRVVTE
jgi:hypothetical protein